MNWDVFEYHYIIEVCRARRMTNIRKPILRYTYLVARAKFTVRLQPEIRAKIFEFWHALSLYQLKSPNTTCHLRLPLPSPNHQRTNGQLATLSRLKRGPNLFDFGFHGSRSGLFSQSYHSRGPTLAPLKIDERNQLRRVLARTMMKLT
ncbi:unnamed protein product [Lactuca virosa]|uniref:Uncharacterized protein n=1 Tax=Lactuca virosa TaxID=75947 RepID=A0AAU9P6K3_9ASTR|nr:unnamed protein product [Lactuca virosa]